MQPSDDTRSATGEGFRTDIEGLRAVAIVAVLVCHAGITWLAGGFVGVDVFFVISGFLITQLLVREAETSDSISLSRFYANRARRILPLSVLLLAAVSALSLVLLSPLRGQEISSDVIDSALYVVNWHFAAESVNYFAQGVEPSPVLHLWSLSVEEQFYLVWPGLLLGIAWLSRRIGGSVRVAAGVAVAVVFAGSLAFGIAQTAADPAPTYFSTFARAWELALGAGLALVSPLRMPRALAALLGWAGLAAIVYAVIDFSETIPFPGVAALLPTLGTAALIVAGASLDPGFRPAPAALLSLPPVRYVGRISYSWYLWHWPALVFAVVMFGPLSAPAGVAAVLVSLLPTIAGHHLLENPVRRRRTLVRIPRRGLALGSLCMATAALAGYMLFSLQPNLETLPASQANGARDLPDEPSPERRAAAIRPNPLQAPGDLPHPVEEGCLLGVAGTESGPCVYGDPQGQRTLVLFGDSHAMQQFPDIEVIARRNRWRLLVLTKRECTPAEVPIVNMAEGGGYPQCDLWRQNALRRIEASGPNTAVALSGDTAERAAAPGGGELRSTDSAHVMEAGYVTTLKRLQLAGLATVVIGDSPEAPAGIPNCVSENLKDFKACAFRPSDGWARGFDLRAARRAGSASVAISQEICPQGRCRAVIGNVLVYRDNAHLTSTYARSLNRWLEPRLKRALGLEPAR